MQGAESHDPDSGTTWLRHFARSKWYALIPAITREDEAVWVQVTYEIEFRRVGRRVEDLRVQARSHLCHTL
jgi:hypothetical protein